MGTKEPGKSRIIHGSVKDTDECISYSQEAAETAANQSALLNRAYQTLLSPRKRGEYILSQQGVDILEADNMEEEQDLMLQVMEAREELEEAEGDEVKELLEANRRAYLFYLEYFSFLNIITLQSELKRRQWSWRMPSHTKTGRKQNEQSLPCDIGIRSNVQGRAKK